MRNIVSALIVGGGSLLAVLAKPWWQQTWPSTEYNPAVIVGISLFVAWYVRGLMDPN